MSAADAITPPVFDCRRRRHKVITADAICVKCGARGVVDARRLPPLDLEPPAAPAQLDDPRNNQGADT